MTLDKQILNSLEQIEKRLFERLSVDDIISDIYVSKYHFQRQFRKHIGSSIMEYIAKRKLSLAGKDICITDSTILDIALKYGYGTAEGFSRAFKAYHGFSPSQCRKYKVFSKNTLHKENLSMKLQVLKYSNNIDSIVKDLNDFSVTIRNIADYTLKKAQDLGLENYKVIASEMNSVAESLFLVCNKFSVNSEKILKINNCFELIKSIEDTVNLISAMHLNINIQIERQNEKLKLELKDLKFKYDECEEISKLKLANIKTLYLELKELIASDIKEMIITSSKNIQSELDKICNLTTSTLKAIDHNNLTMYKDYIITLQKSLKDIIQELESSYSVNMPSEELEDSLVTLSKQLYRIQHNARYLNTLSMSAKLDLTRFPKDKGKFIINDCIKNLNNRLKNMVKVYKKNMAEIESLILLLKKSQNELGRETQNNRVNYIIFKANMMKFYVNSEYQKCRKILNKQHQTSFEKILGNINKITTSIIELNKKTIWDNYIKEIAVEVLQISKDLLKIAKVMKDKGAVISLLSDEYKSYSQLVLNL